MLTAAWVLALVAGILTVVSLAPEQTDRPLLNVAVLLLTVAVFLLGYR